MGDIEWVQGVQHHESYHGEYEYLRLHLHTSVHVVAKLKDRAQQERHNKLEFIELDDDLLYTKVPNLYSLAWIVASAQVLLVALCTSKI